MKTKSKEQVEVQAEAPAAPSVTIDGIHEKIARHMFFRVEDTTLTICVLQLQNGMYIVGESACVSPENFDEAKGQELAFKDAEREIWLLEGYLLREKLYNESLGLAS